MRQVINNDFTAFPYIKGIINNLAYRKSFGGDVSLDAFTENYVTFYTT
jgi:hypothetical protein